MVIAVASGKGGTGKTTVAVNLARVLGDVQFLDCDVEEPNAHLFLKPDLAEKIPARVMVPEIVEERCTYCGKCAEVCAFNAIAVIPPKDALKGGVLVFPNLCHSCGACFLLCPEGAIREVPREIGVVESGRAGAVRFAHGRLHVGEAMSPPLIRQVKKFVDRTRTTLIDAPPGTSCPVINALEGSDYCLLVTEPTPFGLNDLVLAVDVLRVMGIRHGLVINRCDIGDDGVERYARDNGIPVLMRIPFDREIAERYSRGQSIVETDEEYAKKYRGLFEAIRNHYEADRGHQRKRRHG
ncbi:MAG: ferredoxin [Syntrophaceae bacterium PtaB.Bin038]|nr:MAG: ferredoxin [Syntrophaceae bacterium PtaB.Bin038]